MVRIQLLSLLLPLLSVQLCSIDSESESLDNCENTILTVKSLEEVYDCVNTKHGLEIELQDNFTLIRSQSEYERLVTGECQPTIDFSTFDLVIGKQGLTNGNDSITYTLQLNCETSNLELAVEFKQNLTDVAPNLTYHALIPKLSETQTLSVDIKIN